MRSFVWIRTISISFLNTRQFLENDWWSSQQWKHLTSLQVHLSLLCPWQLQRAHVPIVSWHLFAVCPHLKHVLQLIGLSKYSKTLVFACSRGISMNLGGSFSLKVSKNGVEEMFLVGIQVAFFTSRRLYSFFSSFPYSSISGML